MADITLSTLIDKFLQETLSDQADVQSLYSLLNLTGVVIHKGAWDASVGTFPGSGAAQTGWQYRVSVGGTVNGIVFTAGDDILAIADNASTTTYAANWLKGDNTDSDVVVPDNAITLAKMAHGTDGNLITFDADGAPAFVAAGNAAQVLTSNGAGAAPTFQAAAGGAISDPGVAYVRTDGNDTTGDGSPSKPWLTMAKAITEGYTCFNLGVGTFAGGTTNLTGNFSIIGAGKNKTTITNFTFSGGGANLYLSEVCVAFLDLCNAGEFTITGGKIDFVIRQAGGMAEMLTLLYCECGQAAASGEVGADGDDSNPSSDGGAGGQITAKFCTFSNGISAVGGGPGADMGGGSGATGTGGNLTLIHCNGVDAIAGSDGNLVMSLCSFDTTDPAPTGGGYNVIALSPA